MLINMSKRLLEIARPVGIDAKLIQMSILIKIFTDPKFSSPQFVITRGQGVPNFLESLCTSYDIYYRL